MKQILYKGAAIKVLRRMTSKQSGLIRSKIEAYAADPASLANNVVRLAGRHECRLRVGDWRVIFAESSGVIEVLVIGPRGSVYR